MMHVKRNLFLVGLILFDFIKPAHFACDSRRYYKLREIPTDLRQDADCINLGGNYIKIVRSEAFKKLKNCNNIYLNHNSISRIEQAGFKGVKPRLSTLELGNNKLKLIKADMWIGIEFIHNFYLENNLIEYISFDSFGPNLDMYELRLGKNKIKNLDVCSFQSAFQLHRVLLSGNKLNSVPCFSNNPPMGILEDYWEYPYTRKYGGLILSLYDNPLESQPHTCWIRGDFVDDWELIRQNQAEYIKNKNNGWDENIWCVNKVCDKPLKEQVEEWGRNWGHCCKLMNISQKENCTRPNDATTTSKETTIEALVTDTGTKKGKVKRRRKSKKRSGGNRGREMSLFLVVCLFVRFII